MNSYVADTPSDGAFLTRCTSLISLAFDTKVHDVVTANGAVIDDNVCNEG